MSSNSAYGFDNWSAVVTNQVINPGVFYETSYISNAGRVASEVSIELAYHASATAGAILQVAKELDGTSSSDIRMEDTVSSVWSIYLPFEAGRTISRVLCIPANRVGRFSIRILNTDTAQSITGCSVKERKIRSATSEIGSLTPEEIGAEPYIIKKTAFNKDFGTLAGTVCEGDDPRLSDTRTPSAHPHLKADITDFAHQHDAASITSGVFDLARIPAGALERLIVVANQTERFALTTAAVQLGDSVKQEDTNIMYRVVNTNALHLESGYVPYVASRAAAVDWTGVENKPAAGFLPASHGNERHSVPFVPTTRKIIGGFGLTIDREDLAGNPTITCVFGKEENTVCQGNDPRLEDTRPPGDHGNEAHTTPFLSEGDLRLSDARIPLEHKSTHAQGGTDYLSPSDIGAANAVHGTHVDYSNADPRMAGTAAQGTSPRLSRQDHVHPTDTTRAAEDHDHDFSEINGTTTYSQLPVTELEINFCASDDPRLSDARPASDVYAWAKKASLDINDVPNIPTTKVAGTLDIAQIPKAALERLVIVANQAARYALTTDTAQNGDTIKEQDTGLMYFVVDDTKLNQAAGYEVYTAGVASSIHWSGIEGIPSTFPPSTHDNSQHSVLYTPQSRTITAGNGLTDGGDLTTNRTITLGDPSDCTNLTQNSVTATSHTHRVTGFSPADHTHPPGSESPNLPTADEKAALAGTSGAPSSTNKYVTHGDARLSELHAATLAGHAWADQNVTTTSNVTFNTISCNSSGSVKSVKMITISDVAPTEGSGVDGDVWLEY